MLPSPTAASHHISNIFRRSSSFSAVGGAECDSVIQSAPRLLAFRPHELVSVAPPPLNQTRSDVALCRKARGDLWSDHCTTSSPRRPHRIHLSVGPARPSATSPCHFPSFSLHRSPSPSIFHPICVCMLSLTSELLLEGGGDLDLSGEEVRVSGTTAAGLRQWAGSAAEGNPDVSTSCSLSEWVFDQKVWVSWFPVQVQGSLVLSPCAYEGSLQVLLHPTVQKQVCQVSRCL